MFEFEGAELGKPIERLNRQADGQPENKRVGLWSRRWGRCSSHDFNLHFKITSPCPEAAKDFNIPEKIVHHRTAGLERNAGFLCLDATQIAGFSSIWDATKEKLQGAAVHIRSRRNDKFEFLADRSFGQANI